MIEIIPTILVKSFKEVKQRIRKVEDCVNWIQLDIMDGRFVDNTTWPSYAKASEGKPNLKEELKKLRSLRTRVKLEAHLMIQEPEKVINDWLEVVDRVIIHYEACNNPKDLIEKVQSKEKQIGLAINPETSIDVVKPFLNDLDLILIMTVQPGQGGQEFKDEVLSKIETLRMTWPDGNIEVDGGINPETSKKTINAGANLICAGTYIFKSKDTKEAISRLKEK